MTFLAFSFERGVPLPADSLQHAGADESGEETTEEDRPEIE
jgi:hypothetical protein